MGWFTSPRDALPEELERVLYPTRHLAQALEKHASGLRLSLYGLLLMLCGLLGLLIVFVVPLLNLEQAGRNVLNSAFGPAIMLAVIGGFVNMWGKYRCFEFPIPLSGRWLLSVAILPRRSTTTSACRWAPPTTTIGEGCDSSSMGAASRSRNWCSNVVRPFRADTTTWKTVLRQSSPRSLDLKCI
jgi:hypothetical protein